jgi:DNA topoisomerase IB
VVEQQKDLLTNRWRKVRAPDPLEVQVQIALIQHLHWRARRGVVYFHCPNGELRDKKSAAKLRAMGVLPGVSDLVFVWIDDEGQLHNLYLELKARGRKPTPEQVAFADAIRDAGAEYDFADNLDDALRLLDARGLLRSTPLR